MFLYTIMFQEDGGQLGTKSETTSTSSRYVTSRLTRLESRAAWKPSSLSCAALNTKSVSISGRGVLVTPQSLSVMNK